MNHRQTGKRTHTIECISRRRCCATQNKIHRETKNICSGCNETQESHWCLFQVNTTTTTTTAKTMATSTAIATMTHSRQVEHDSLPPFNRRKRNNFYIVFAIVVITVLSWCDPVSAVTKHANYIAQKSGESHIFLSLSLYLARSLYVGTATVHVLCVLSRFYYIFRRNRVKYADVSPVTSVC